MIKLDLAKTIYALTEEHPALIAVLKEMGFMGVVNPVVRNTLGRKTTLLEGCEKMGKDPAWVIAELKKKGFDAELPR